MDKERAKFILQSFRPDGADADEATFAEALALAAKDRELGEWLADERSQDATFAAQLMDLKIPNDLREAILEVLEENSAEPAEFDSDFVGAIASVIPPAGLRDQILGAMEVEQNVVQMPKQKRGFFKTVMWTTSAAAVVLAMVVVTFFFAGAGGNALAGTTPQEIEYSAIEMLDSPFFSLDLRNDRQAALYEWLDGKNLPKPDQLPEGLDGIKGVGCKFLEVGDLKQRGSLICYRKDDKIVHLVMMDRDTLADQQLHDLSGAKEQCRVCDQDNDWAVTRWADAEHAYFLLSKMEPQELAAIF